MFWLDKKSYKRTLAVLRKKVALAPIFAELKCFIESEFGITIFDIVFKKYNIFNKPKEYSLAYGKRYQLTCQVASNEERESMQNKIRVADIGEYPAYTMRFDEQKRTQIIAKFLELAKKHNFSTAAKINEIWLDYYFSFSIDYMNFIVNKIEAATSNEMMHKYKVDADIWRIESSGYGITVFYTTEKKKERNEQNGISDAIKNEYFAVIKTIDEFGFYKEEYIRFDSKENLDKNYDGSLYYYFR